jgi:hypothetical protein
MYANSNYAFSLGETDGWSFGPEGRQPHSDSLNRWTDSLVCVHHAVNWSPVACRGLKYMVENQYTNKHNNENNEVPFTNFNVSSLLYFLLFFIPHS